MTVVRYFTTTMFLLVAIQLSCGSRLAPANDGNVQQRAGSPDAIAAGSPLSRVVGSPFSWTPILAGPFRLTSTIALGPDNPSAVVRVRNHVFQILLQMAENSHR